MPPSDPTSLDNLRDIAEPPPVSWWPMAAGWWVLLAIFAIAAIWISFRSWRSWRKRAYRRAAMRELSATSSSARVAELLKRVALAAYPRSEVASRSGASWCDWLERTGLTAMPESVRKALTIGIFAEGRSTHSPELAEFAEQWILRHRVTNQAKAAPRRRSETRRIPDQHGREDEIA